MTRVLLWSFGIGVAVQAVAILAARRFRNSGGSKGGSSGWITGWGIGALLRLASVIVYAFVAQPVLGLPVAPALISLAGFLFLTSLIESIYFMQKSA